MTDNQTRVLNNKRILSYFYYIIAQLSVMDCQIRKQNEAIVKSGGEIGFYII